MSKAIFLAAVAAVTALSSGCALIDRTLLKPAAEASRVPPLFRTTSCEAYPYPDGSKNAIDPTAWRNPLVKNECEALEDAISQTQLTLSPCKDDVNLKECAAYLEHKSDVICEVHLSKIFGNRAVTNMMLGTLTAATGIAGGLVSGGAANALSGSAGFLTADRSLFNEEIYRNYLAEAVIKEIVKNRDTAKAEIVADVVGGNGISSAKVITGHNQLIQRVSEMHGACSFYAGLTSLLGKAGKDDYAVNLKTGVAAQIDFLKAELMSAKADVTAATAADKPKLQVKVDNLEHQIVQLTLTLNLMAAGHAIDAPPSVTPAASAAAPTPKPVTPSPADPKGTPNPAPQP